MGRQGWYRSATSLFRPRPRRRVPVIRVFAAGRRRARQLVWVVAIVAVALFLTAAGVMLSRATRLFGLPDIGDPFDVAAFRVSNNLPDDQDAAVLIRKAAAMASQRPALPAPLKQIDLTKGWSKIDPQLRGWLEENRDAARALSQGCGAIGRHRESRNRTGRRFRLLVGFRPVQLAGAARGLAARRPRRHGGAWSWYQTVLRFRVLVMRRGSVFQRYFVDRQCEQLQSQIESWSANRKTGIPILHRALDDVVACEPRPEWDADSLKTDYLFMMADLKRPDGPLQHGNGAELDYQFADMKLPAELATLHARGGS